MDGVLSGDLRPLGLADYEAVGGIRQSLEFELDGIWEGIAGPAQEIARKVFQRLTEQDAAGRLTTRPTRLSDLVAIAGAPHGEVIAVLDTFRDPERTLLLPGGVALDDQSIIDIAHEAIIREWPRLRKWIEEERSSAESYRRLATVAVEHKNGLASYYREPELTIALEWRERVRPTAAWAQQYHPEFEAAMRFLDESRAHQEREMVERERTRYEKERGAMVRRVFVVGVVLVLVLFALMLYLRWRWL
jgi:hypothetical protein